MSTNAPSGSLLRRRLTPHVEKSRLMRPIACELSPVVRQPSCSEFNCTINAICAHLSEAVLDVHMAREGVLRVECDLDGSGTAEDLRIAHDAVVDGSGVDGAEERRNKCDTTHDAVALRYAYVGDCVLEQLDMVLDRY